MNEAYVTFTQEFERSSTHEELADLLEMKVSDIVNVLQGGGRHLSMDAPVGGDDGDAAMIDLFIEKDQRAPDLALMDESLKDEVKFGLSLLSSREIEVLSSYYGLNGHKSLTLEEIGELYGLTRERVRQIKERALRRLRKAVNRNALKSYLG